MAQVSRCRNCGLSSRDSSCNSSYKGSAVSLGDPRLDYKFGCEDVKSTLGLVMTGGILEELLHV